VARPRGSAGAAGVVLAPEPDGCRIWASGDWAVAGRDAKKKKMRMTVLEMTGFIRKEDMVFSRARFARTR
jgi:hypothetical protein